MARDRSKHAREEGALPAAAPLAVAASNVPLATGQTQPHHRDQLLALIRALARDAAREDHEQDITAKSGR